jgi:hypothetical protein
MFKPTKRYRPERHYMRGPGPKWLEKHAGGINRVGPVMEDHRRTKHLLAGFISQFARLGGGRLSQEKTLRAHASRPANANVMATEFSCH